MTGNLTGNTADITGDVTPAQKLDALTADPKWVQQLLTGGGVQMRELQEVLQAKSAGGDQIGQIIDGVAKPSELETVTGGALTTHKQMVAAAQLREDGIPDASIRQLLEGNPVSKEEYNAVAKLKAERLGDPEYVKRWLAGERKQVIEMTQIGIVLAGGFKDAA
jgi:hypothetical protein